MFVVYMKQCCACKFKDVDADVFPVPTHAEIDFSRLSLKKK